MAQVKEVRGPGPRGAGQPRPKVENPGLLLKRIMGEVFKHYLPHCIIVLFCIVASAMANVQASLSAERHFCPRGVKPTAPTPGSHGPT